MTMLLSPAPFASTDPGLEFGNTTVYPYSEARPHQGKDHKWSYARVVKSRQVHAPVTGRVIKVVSDGKNNGGWGNYVDIEIIPGIFVRLAHLANGSIRVKTGDRVEAGDRIATMGATGETGGKVHLHEELWIHGKRVNPDLYRGPNGRHVPGTAPKPTPPTSTPKPAPAGALSTEEDEMTVDYHKPKNSNNVYALYDDGTVRHVGKVEWILKKAAYKVAGRKLPYTVGQVTEAEIATLPKRGK